MDRRHVDLSLIGVHRFAGWFGAALCGLGLLACGQQVPNEPAPAASQLCSDDFKTCVMPVLTRPIRRAGGSVVSCGDSNCHALGGSGGRFTLGPDEDANFLSVSNFVNRTNPDASLLLIEPAADSVLSSPAAAFHGGGDIFPSSSDACFQALRGWIANQAACGSCVPVPNNVNCGYP